MGNKVNINLNSDIYFPSQIIQGNVTIETCEKILKDVSKLYLHLQGEEFFDTSFIGCSSSDGYNIFYSQFKLLKDLKLEENPGSLQKTIVFPFTYKLDDNLAGSALWDIEYKFKIVYTLSVLAETHQGDRVVLQQIPLEIRQFVTKPLQIQHYTSSKEIRGFFHQYKGISKIDCNINGEEFSFGDQLDIELIVDQTESQRFIEEIEISLIKKITVNTKTRRIIGKKIQSHQLPGVAKGITTTFKKSIVLFDFKNEMIPSSQGQVLNIEYVLRIQALSVMFNINLNDNTIDIPIKIYQRPIKLKELNFQTNEIPELFHQYPVVNL